MAEHPQQIGKYRVTRPLGKGAMGMVYEGFDPVIERKVAIKTILGDYLDAAEMEDAIARFKREAQAGGRLQHPNIVGVFEYGGDGAVAFIVMEYVEGDELKKLLSGGKRFELIDVFEIMKQLLAALDYSHKQGVVHRDIKPANLMIMTGTKVKVMDFGIARLESSSLTQTGTAIGTPTHMSPEQLMGHTADGRSDLWASGVILYELLTGVSPFLAQTPATVMHKVLQSQPPKPSTVNAALPPAFDAVIDRALAKRADDRFQTAREFQAAMLQALQGKAPASTASVMKRTGAAAAPAPAQPAVTIAPGTLAEIERSLSRHVGPLAGVLVKRSQAEAGSVEDFFKALAEHVPEGDEQNAFMKKMAGVKSAVATQKIAVAPGGAAAKPAATRHHFTPETLSTIEKSFATYVGPLARVLIKEAAGKSGNLKELYGQLAAHIDSEEERRAFLASLQ
ncbi:MAG TPA: serine/threonine-protein kinase [Usitatibacter sp.]|nr:serine/threonine-protein kinase [Usitatibacter sp.]